MNLHVTRDLSWRDHLDDDDKMINNTLGKYISEKPTAAARRLGISFEIRQSRPGPSQYKLLCHRI